VHSPCLAIHYLVYPVNPVYESLVICDETCARKGFYGISPHVGFAQENINSFGIFPPGD
jgi:hypothetical protein